MLKIVKCAENDDKTLIRNKTCCILEENTKLRRPLIVKMQYLRLFPWPVPFFKKFVTSIKVKGSMIKNIFLPKNNEKLIILGKIIVQQHFSVSSIEGAMNNICSLKLHPVREESSS